MHKLRLIAIGMFAALGAVAFGSPARATEQYSMSGAYCAAGGREGELVRPVVRSAPCVPPRAPLALSGAPVERGFALPLNQPGSRIGVDQDVETE